MVWDGTENENSPAMPTDDVEQRGAAQTQNEADLSSSSIPSLVHRRRDLRFLSLPQAGNGRFMAAISEPRVHGCGRVRPILAGIYGYDICSRPHSAGPLLKDL